MSSRVPWHLERGDVRTAYMSWPSPSAIISDGAYGLGGFPGDPRGVDTLPSWYQPHIEAWSARANPATVDGTAGWGRGRRGWRDWTVMAGKVLGGRGCSRRKGMRAWEGGCTTWGGGENWSAALAAEGCRRHLKQVTLRSWKPHGGSVVETRSTDADGMASAGRCRWVRCGLGRDRSSAAATEICVFYRRRLTFGPGDAEVPAKVWLREEWLRPEPVDRPGGSRREG